MSNQNQTQNNQAEQQAPAVITRDEFENIIHNLLLSYDKKLGALVKQNEKLQGEVDALKAFASEIKKQKEISDIRTEARNQVLRELGYEVSGSESISTTPTNNNNNNSSSGKSSSCFDHLFDWRNPNRRGLFG